MTKFLFILLFLFGCFDEYSPIKQEDIYGCTDDTACNFNDCNGSDSGMPGDINCSNTLDTLDLIIIISGIL